MQLKGGFTPIYEVANKATLRHNYRMMKLFDVQNKIDSESKGEMCTADANSTAVSLVRRGPPNRMNDLPYREWMKFQKSFFRYSANQTLVEECIYFFTKALWVDNVPSRSLLVGMEDFNPSFIPAPRIVELCPTLDRISHLTKTKNQYDFILLDLRNVLSDQAALAQFLSEDADNIFRLLRELLAPHRYCGVIVGTEKQGGTGFPIAWSVALASRKHLKLRDEKIGLIEAEGRIFYCLFMQAEDDEREAIKLKPSDLKLVQDSITIPAWIIPKPPPRKKNEILHPAKYPETMVSEFIRLFTKPGDTVLDPMVGTGSTLVAAVQMQRNGVGIDLSQDFVEIAQRRVAAASMPTLFEELQTSWEISQGDATHLGFISALNEKCFNYCVTSPPYWSMLSNPGSENQEGRRKKNLPLTYSDNGKDLGNIEDYDKFLNLLEEVYDQVADRLVDDGYLTVVVKNVKRNHVLYPLAWDLTMRLSGECGRYNYLGTTLWCQDDVGLKPFAVGIHWVSNILHHYCLHFRKRDQLLQSNLNSSDPSSESIVLRSSGKQ